MAAREPQVIADFGQRGAADRFVRIAPRCTLTSAKPARVHAEAAPQAAITASWLGDIPGVGVSTFVRVEGGPELRSPRLVAAWRSAGGRP